MNDKRERGAPPKGGKVDHYSVPPSDPAFKQVANRYLERFKFDPTWGEGSCNSFGPLFTNPPTCNHFKKASLMIGMFIKDAPSELVEELFGRILTMKRNHEAASSGNLHRNSYALMAWQDFSKEFGYNPTKRKLKRYILASPSIYKNMPNTGDTKGWTRMWEATGLDELVS